MPKNTPNRTAALGASAAAVVAVLVSLLGAVDTDRKAAVLIAALALVALVVCVFLVGGQRWEELIFRRDNDTPDVKVTTTNEPPRDDRAPRLRIRPSEPLRTEDPDESYDPAGGYDIEASPEDAIVALVSDEEAGLGR